jgi:LacI family transcriptional regulator
LGPPHYIDLFYERGAKGLLLMSAANVTDRLRYLKERGVPSIMVGHRQLADEFPSVFFDEDTGGYLATKHLIDGGRRSIAFVGATQGIPQIADRLLGASRAVSEVPDATLELLGVEGLTMEGGRAAAKRIVSREGRQRPDAIFAANDLIAIGLVQTLILDGSVRIPDEIAIIGYDDNIFAQTAMLPLSSIRTHGAELGKVAVQMLLDELGGLRPAAWSEIIRPQLVMRASTSKSV